MTNQDAIKIIDIAKNCYPYNSPIREAFNTAIKALEKLDKGKASIESYAAKVWEDLLTDD